MIRKMMHPLHPPNATVTVPYIAAGVGSSCFWGLGFPATAPDEPLKSPLAHLDPNSFSVVGRRFRSRDPDRGDGMAAVGRQPANPRLMVQRDDARFQRLHCSSSLACETAEAETTNTLPSSLFTWDFVAQQNFLPVPLFVLSPLHSFSSLRIPPSSITD